MSALSCNWTVCPLGILKGEPDMSKNMTLFAGMAAMVVPTWTPPAMSFMLAKPAAPAEPIMVRVMPLTWTALLADCMLHWPAKTSEVPALTLVPTAMAVTVKVAKEGEETVAEVIKLPITGKEPETLEALDTMSEALSMLN